MRAREVDPALANFIAPLLSIMMKIMLLISVASMVGVATTSFIAVLGAMGLAIGLALQGSLANFAGQWDCRRLNSVLRRANHKHPLRIAVKSPLAFEIGSERLAGQSCAYQFYRHPASLHNGIVKLTGSHIAGLHDFFIQFTKLQGADHVRDLVQRCIDGGASYFRFRVRPFVSNAVHQKVDSLLWRPVSEVIIQ